MAIIAFLIKVPTGFLGAYIIEAFNLDNPLFSSQLQEPTFTLQDIFFAVVFAPILETFFAQAIPMKLILFATKSKYAAIIGSSTLFMMMHFPVIEFFPSAFVVGLIFAWAWSIKVEKGNINAFWIVTLIHSLHNAIVVATAALLL